MTKRKKENGYLIIEVLIAVVILIMISLPIFTSISFLQLKTKQSQYDSEASLLLQEGMEIAYNTVVSDWESYSDGVYFPAYDADEDVWILIPGEETELKTRYTRKIELKTACRNVSDGTQIEYDGFCSGELDLRSKNIITTLAWDEKGSEKELSARLLSFNFDEE